MQNETRIVISSFYQTGESQPKSNCMRITAVAGHPIWQYVSAALLTLVFCGLTMAQTGSDGATPKMTQPGAPAGSYALSGFETVNLFNGNLNFNLPLAKIGGRGKVGSAINLAIDSARWQVERDVTTQERQTLTYERQTINQNRYVIRCRRNADTGNLEDCQTTFEPSNDTIFSNVIISDSPGSEVATFSIYEDTEAIQAGYGPGVVFGRGASHGGTQSQYKSTLTRLYFVSSDGTELELRDTLTGGKANFGTLSSTPPFNRGTVFTSADGSGVKFVSDTPIADDYQIVLGGLKFMVSGYLYFPDGTMCRVENGGIAWLQDVDGNRINYTYNPATGTTGIFDPLGRETRVTYGNATEDPEVFFDAISTPKSATEWQTVKVYRTRLGNVLRGDYSLMTRRQMFPELFLPATEPIYNPGGVVSKVELPDGRSYKLFYTPYNEIARVELPTGAAYEYDFPMPGEQGTPGFGGTVFRPIKERRIYADGGSSVTNS